MLPTTIIRSNPFEGLSVQGVRDSFDSAPVKSVAAAALFGATLYWGLKSAKKSGPVGAVIKGMIAVAVMNKAKNALVSAQNGNGGRQLAAV
jgi:hypothetical protein